MEVVILSDNLLNISWDPPFFPNGDIFGYQVIIANYIDLMENTTLVKPIYFKKTTLLSNESDEKIGIYYYKVSTIYYIYYFIFSALYTIYCVSECNNKCWSW